MSYFWRALPFTCGFVNGFKIISDSNCGAYDGVWFLSSSLAGYVSGLIAGLMAVPNDVSPTESDAAISLEIYSSNFEILAGLSVIVAICLFLINPLIKRYLTN